MRNALILLAGLVSGIVLAGGGGVISALQDVLIGEGLLITGAGSDVDLPPASVDEEDLNIGNAPTDDHFLQWDAAGGKPMWQEIGFDSGTYSYFPGFPSGAFCPTVAGGTQRSTSRLRWFSSGGTLPSGTLSISPAISTVMVVQSKPRINFDVTLNSASSTNTIQYVNRDGQRVALSRSPQTSPVLQRLTGRSAALPTGPYAIAVYPTGGSYSAFAAGGGAICRSISRVWVSP